MPQTISPRPHPLPLALASPPSSPHSAVLSFIIHLQLPLFPFNLLIQPQDTAIMSVPAFSDIAKPANDVSHCSEIISRRFSPCYKACARDRERAPLCCCSDLLTSGLFFSRRFIAPQQGFLPPLCHHLRIQGHRPQRRCLQGHWQVQPREGHLCCREYHLPLQPRASGA